MRILDLPLMAVWFLMIESGEKKEEYREIKPYWIKRLKCCGLHPSAKGCDGCPVGSCDHYTHVRFRYGYTARTMLFKLDRISVGVGQKKWGAPDKKEVNVLKLGERIE